MIDLSQSHGVQGDTLRRNLYRSVASPYCRYPLLGVDPGVVTLRSYSVEGFLEHMAMIHHTEEEPSDVSKCEKRATSKYVGFLFARVFSPDVPGSHAHKLRAMRALADRLSSLQALAASPP